MSASVAVCPFFITCVDSLTLSWSESWCFDLSSLSTLPVTCELDELEALPGVLLDAEPEPIDPLDEPDEPVPREPDEPLDFESSDFDGSDGLADEPELLPDDPLPIEPEEPDDPVLDEPLEPLVPPAADCAPAGSAMRRPAIPRPANMPLFTFMFPSRLLR